MPTEKFVNQAFGNVLESAANTLTFSEINTGVSLFEKRAWIIHQILWYTHDEDILLASADYIQMALTSHNKMSTLGLEDPAVIDLMELAILWNGTPANTQYHNRPVIRDLSNLPGGGLIVPSNKIFVATRGWSLGGPSATACRIYYTVLDLKADDYWELVEASRMTL